MAEICVKAVLSVADLARKDVNLDLIKVRAGTRRAVQSPVLFLLGQEMGQEEEMGQEMGLIS